MINNLIRFKTLLLAWRQRVSNWLWGYDYFISYDWRSGGKYAIGLSQILQEKKYDCFLDKTEFVAGDDWKKEAGRALQNTQRLIVIATREAMTESEPVEHEISFFSNRSKHIIPIRFGNTYTEEEKKSLCLTKIAESVIRLADSPNALKTGIPDNSEVINKLIATDKILRRRKLRVRIVSATISVLTIALVGAVILGGRTATALKDEEKARLNAEERTMEAGIEKERAIAAQNFAEYYRVSERARSVEVTPDEKRALEAIAPKYFTQSRNYLSRATILNSNLEEWRNRLKRVDPDPKKAFSLEIIPSRVSGSLILYFGEPSDPKFMLIDGGDNKGYRETLRPVLQRLRRQFGKSQKLELDLVVSSQTDRSQIGGLSAMFRELDSLRKLGKRDWLSVKNLWANSFLPTVDEGPFTYADDEKIDMLVASRSLNIPKNKPFTKWIAIPETGAARVHWNDELDVTVLAPKLESMIKFTKYWIDRYKKKAAVKRLPFYPDFTDLDVVETFSDPRIELLPSPILPTKVNKRSGRKDYSEVNRASIVLMLEFGKKRMLLASDSTGEILLETLSQAGYMDANKFCKVDTLILPHDGSDRNVSKEFFSRVIANHYIALGDGRYDNPDVGTFRLLLEARRATKTPFTIYLTRHPNEFRNVKYRVDKLLTLFKSERAMGIPFKVFYPQEPGASFAHHLLEKIDNMPNNLVELEF